MSTAELNFTKKYAEMRFEYYQNQVFKHLVRNYRDFKDIEVLLAKKEGEGKEKKVYVQTNRKHELRQNL
jgi:hypothetical protein